MIKTGAANCEMFILAMKFCIPTDEAAIYVDIIVPCNTGYCKDAVINNTCPHLLVFSGIRDFHA